MPLSPFTSKHQRIYKTIDTCEEGFFKCVKEKKCIHEKFVCDGNMDCSYEDSSDEDNCAEVNTTTILTTPSKFMIQYWLHTKI